MELFKRETGVSLTHIPYKGSAPALMDVLAGQVLLAAVPASGTMQHIQSGKIKVLAVSGTKRSPDLPQVPTFEELGYKQLTVVSWVGLSAPKRTPPDIVRKLNAAIRESIAKPELALRLEADGITPMPMSAEEYAEFVRSETERWGSLTRSLNLQPN